jgi:transcriptional regulator
VSPDWYGEPGFVPTWNYIAIEAAGTAQALDDAALRKVVNDLSAEHEARLSPKTPWTMEKVAPDRQARLLQAIRGFAIPFDTLEGKFKLSQDKSATSRAGVVRALDASARPEDQAVAGAMRRFAPDD